MTLVKPSNAISTEKYALGFSMTIAAHLSTGPTVPVSSPLATDVLPLPRAIVIEPWPALDRIKGPDPASPVSPASYA